MKLRWNSLIWKKQIFINRSFLFLFYQYYHFFFFCFRMSTSWFMKSYSDWLSHEKTNTFTVTNIYEIGACCEFNYLSHNVNANRKYSVHTLILKKNIFKSDTFNTTLLVVFFMFCFCFVFLFVCFFLFCFYVLFSFV